MIGFWFFMLLMDLLIPSIMIGSGRLFITSPPKEINNSFGYKTSMSMKNKDTWEFAHKLCGKLWFIGGLILLPLSILPLIPMLGKSIDMIAYTGLIVSVVQIVLFIGSIVPIEAALKKKFDQNGHRR